MRAVTLEDLSVFRAGDILPLYASVGWTAYTDRPETLMQGLNSSLAVLCARSGGILVGLCRAVGDGRTIVYIQDLLVHPDYQRQKIGTQLLLAMLARYRTVRQVVLLTDDTERNRSFYRACGLHPVGEDGCAAYIR